MPKSLRTEAPARWIPPTRFGSVFMFFSFLVGLCLCMFVCVFVCVCVCSYFYRGTLTNCSSFHYRCRASQELEALRAQVAAERRAGLLPPVTAPATAVAPDAAWESSLSESMVLGALDLLNGPVPSAHPQPPPPPPSSPPLPPLLPLSTDPVFPVHAVSASAAPAVVPVLVAAPAPAPSHVGWWGDQKGDHPVPPSLQHLDPVTLDPLYLSTR